MDIETQAEAVTPPAEVSAPVLRRGRLVTAVVVGAVVLAGVGGGVAWARHDTAVKIEAALTEATSAADAWSAGDAELDAAVEAARTLLAESQGAVDDTAVLDVLADVLEDAEASATGPGPVVPTADGTGLDEARQAAQDAAAAVGAQRRAADELEAAVDAVEESRAAFELAEAAAAAESARAELAAAMTTGEDVLKATEGQVQDNAVRKALRDALDAAALARDAQVDVDDVDALTAAAEALTTEKGAVEAATRSVNEAHDVWVQAENDRKATASTPAPQVTTPAAQQPQGRPTGVQPQPVQSEPQPQPQPEPIQPVQPQPAPDPAPADPGPGMTDDEYWEKVTGGHDTVCFQGETEWLC